MAHQDMDPLEAAVADPVAGVEIMVQVVLRVAALVVMDHLGVTTAREETRVDTLVGTAILEIVTALLETQVAEVVAVEVAGPLVETMEEGLRVMDTEVQVVEVEVAEVEDHPVETIMEEDLLGVDMEVGHPVVATVHQVDLAVEVVVAVVVGHQVEAMEGVLLVGTMDHPVDQAVEEEDVVEEAPQGETMEEDHLATLMAPLVVVVEDVVEAALLEEIMVVEIHLAVGMAEDLQAIIMVRQVDLGVVDVVVEEVDLQVGTMEEDLQVMDMVAQAVEVVVVEVVAPLGEAMVVEDHLGEHMGLVDHPVVDMAHQVAQVVEVEAVGASDLQVETMEEGHLVAVMDLEDQVVGEVDVVHPLVEMVTVSKQKFFDYVHVLRKIQ